MTPARAIAMLDRQIAARGQVVRFRRRPGAGQDGQELDGATMLHTSMAWNDRLLWVSAMPWGGGVPVMSMRGVVRGYRPEQVTGLVTQADRQVILSPSSLGVFGLPQAHEMVVIGGRPGQVQPDIEQIEIDDVVVRINLRVRMS